MKKTFTEWIHYFDVEAKINNRTAKVISIERAPGIFTFDGETEWKVQWLMNNKNDL